MDPAGVKIFVSSTFVDLKDLRAKVIKWLGEVFEARLVVMETSEATLLRLTRFLFVAFVNVICLLAYTLIDMDRLSTAAVNQ